MASALVTSLAHLSSGNVSMTSGRLEASETAWKLSLASEKNKKFNFDGFDWDVNTRQIVNQNGKLIFINRRILFAQVETWSIDRQADRPIDGIIQLIDHRTDHFSKLRPNDFSSSPYKS